MESKDPKSAGRNPGRPENEAERMPDLDGLRGIAILLVLVCHFIGSTFPSEIVRKVTSFGWCGVDLFFVLSGFLIGGILVDHRDSANYYSVFYVRRFFRIVPLYLLILLPLIIIVALGWQRRFSGHNLAGVGWGTVLAYLTFQQNAIHSSVPGYLAPAWSLAIEEQFYLLLPPFVRNLRRGTLIKLLVFGVLLAPVTRAACCFMLKDQARGIGLAGLLLPCRWDALLPGVLIACGMRDERFRLWITTRLGLVRALWSVLAVGTIGLAAYDTDLVTPRGRVIGFTWIAFFFASTLLLSRANEHGVLRFLLSRPAWKPLATISYGLYLFQGPTMALRESTMNRLGFPQVGWGATGVYAFYLALTFGLALLSWHYFEKPILKRSHRYKFS